MIGKLLAIPFKVANIPIRAFEKFIGEENGTILSKPLDSMAKACEEIDE